MKRKQFLLKIIKSHALYSRFLLLLAEKRRHSSFGAAGVMTFDDEEVPSISHTAQPLTTTHNHTQNDTGRVWAGGQWGKGLGDLVEARRRRSSRGLRVGKWRREDGMEGSRRERGNTISAAVC